MTPTLPQLSGPAGMKASDGGDGDISSHLGGQNGGESFASLMTRVVSPTAIKSKNSDLGAQISTKGQQKKDAGSVAAGLDASALLACSLPISAVPVIATVVTPKIPAEAVASGDDSNVFKTIVVTAGQPIGFKPQTVEASAGKIAPVANPNDQKPDSGGGKPRNDGTLAAAIGLEVVKASPNTEGGAKAVGLPRADAVVPEMKVDLSQTEGVEIPKSQSPSGMVDLGSNVPSENGLPPVGTSIAKVSATMKKSEQTIKIAEITGKFLPGEAVSAVLKKGQFAPGADASPNSGTPALSGSDTGRVAVLDGAPVPVNNGSRIVDRTQEMVVQQAMRLSSSTSESLHVVIKPGEGTQLSLELRQRGDGVEVQAVLQQGDLNLLKQNWSDLQQQLQLRGIHLGSLTSGSDLAGNGGAFLQQRPDGPAGSFEEDSTAVSVAGQSVLASGASVGNMAILNGKSGWQMWA